MKAKSAGVALVLIGIIAVALGLSFGGPMMSVAQGVPTAKLGITFTQRNPGAFAFRHDDAEDWAYAVYNSNGIIGIPTWTFWADPFQDNSSWHELTFNVYTSEPTSTCWAGFTLNYVSWWILPQGNYSVQAFKSDFSTPGVVNLVKIGNPVQVNLKSDTVLSFDANGNAISLPFPLTSDPVNYLTIVGGILTALGLVVVSGKVHL
jgi:hypothetical protein